MKLGTWNIRGLNTPLKQNGVRSFIGQHNIDVLGILETKLGMSTIDQIMRNKFDNLLQINNFEVHRAGRILVIWNSLKLNLEVLETTSQVIHCIVTCKVTSLKKFVSFVYGLHTTVSHRPLWDNIMQFGLDCSLPWLIMGDFNNVLHFDEKINGVDVTTYEIKDFVNCCLNVGLTDLRSIGCFYTWNNNSVWTKLDRAMVNDFWMHMGFSSSAEFLPSGCLSDHSPCIVSIFTCDEVKKKPFKFFNVD